MPTLLIKPCDFKAARFAVSRFHYSHAMPAPPRIQYGVWEDSVFIGAIVFGRGNARHMHTQFECERWHVLELNRVALAEHQTPVSRIVALAIKQLRKAQPELRVLISFSDPREGHHGGIYQAMGWSYMGLSNKERGYLTPDGRIMHSRVVKVTGMTTQFWEKKPTYRVDECQLIILPPKHRYALGLDEAMRTFLLARSKPYPKASSRAGSTMQNAAPNHGEGDGSNPIPALHSETINTVDKLCTVTRQTALPRRLRKRHVLLPLRQRHMR